MDFLIEWIIVMVVICFFMFSHIKKKNMKKLEKERRNNAGTYNVPTQTQPQNARPVVGAPAPPVGTPLYSMPQQEQAQQGGTMVGGVLVGEDEQVVATIGVEPFTDARGREVVRDGVGILTDKYFYYKGIHHGPVDAWGTLGKSKNIESGRVAIKDVLSTHTLGTLNKRRNKVNIIERILMLILWMPLIVLMLVVFNIVGIYIGAMAIEAMDSAQVFKMSLMYFLLD